MLALSTAAGGAYFTKQLIFLAVSLSIVSLIYLLFDLNFYKSNATLIYWLNVGLLLLLKFAGTSVMGSQRWLRLGPVNIQPSEIAKICIIIALAAWLSRRPIQNYFDIIKTLFIVALPALLVLIQPDLGTTLVYAVISFGMLFWAGASLTQLIILISPLITAIASTIGKPLFTFQYSIIDFSVTIPVIAFFVIFMALIAWYYKVWTCPWKASGLFLLMNFNGLVLALRPFLWGLLKEYQQKRLTIFLDPYVDPLGAGYHIIQSLYAIGSGGIFGRGLKAGDLTQGNFVPEQHTDFVFSAIGEELGFIGSIIVVLLYAFLCIRIIRIAEKSSDSFNALIAVGIFSMLTFHIFINIGMNLSLMPITGVPLPFASYGGTSLIVDLFLISLLLKISQASK